MMESIQGVGAASPVRSGLKSRPDRIPGLSLLGLPELSTHCRNLFSPGPTTVLSPVTNLALDMNNLVGLGRFVCGFFTLLKVEAEKLAEVAKCALSSSSLLFTLTAFTTPQKEGNMPLWRRFPPLLLMFPLMLVSSTEI